ncbi:MAG: argininosuccinate synthase [Crenarchaeota archaeon]|nr:argininosuccinate synthase [Thermoproteota archaeon]MDW8033617.1 argininosuccinate synthase [Nitrososphaerota archaeon]
MDELCVLAYSGGLDTSVMIPWIKEKYGMDVIAVIVDVGQKEDFESVIDKAEKLGAVEVVKIDAKEEFVKDYIFKAIKANGLYEGVYPMGTSLSRPLIASKIVEVAEKKNASAVAHGCTGKGNDQVRFEVSIRSLNSSLRIIAPVREWGLSRDEEVKYLEKKGVKIEREKSRFSIDDNLWSRSVEGGELEDPWVEPPEEAFVWSKPISKTPDTPEYITIGFEKGVPVELNGERLNPMDLITRVNEIAGSHGFGRIDHMEDRVVGIKSREVYEAPAALTIIRAHQDLEKLVLTRLELEEKKRIETTWAWLVYSGLWFEPLRKAIDAFIDYTQLNVDGEVRVKLFKGEAMVVGRRSLKSLYDEKRATYSSLSKFDQSLAEGFIQLWGLSTVRANEVRSVKS